MAAEPAVTASRARRHVVCAVEELPPGGRIIVDVDGRSIGVFNVGGHFHALHNRCPHKSGALCAGPITGTVLPSADRSFPYGRDGEIVRCARHGWEFEIATGQALADPRVRARTYPVEVDHGQVVVVLG
jgi:nitrite reductase/ring-hydroxylating ferredoxin subunit